jgi:MFS family permease
MLKFNYLAKPNSLYLLLFSTLFLFLGDAILSYLFPVLVEETVMSFTLVGIIMAMSSGAGLISDLLFPVLFPNLSWKTANLIGVLLGFAFPALLFLGQDYGQPLFFVAAAIIWGIYYEFLGFARQECVIEIDTKRNFTSTWGLIFSILSFCAFVGPIVASITLSSDQIVARLLVFILYSIALFCSVMLATSGTKKTTPSESKIVHTLSFLSEVKYWVILESRTYPMLIVLIFLTIVNSFFWTFGGIHGEELFGSSGLGWLLLVVYTLPDLILSVIFSRIVIKRRKKFLSFILLIVAGLAIIPMLFIHDSLMLLFAVALFSSFNCISLLLMRAVFSDLESRAAEFKVHVEAVYQSTHSVGYIAGPLISGVLVQAFGFKETFIIWGLLSIAIGGFLIAVTPEKLKIPKARLRSV